MPEFVLIGCGYGWNNSPDYLACIAHRETPAECMEVLKTSDILPNSEGHKLAVYLFECTPETHPEEVWQEGVRDWLSTCGLPEPSVDSFIQFLTNQIEEARQYGANSLNPLTRLYREPFSSN